MGTKSHAGASSSGRLCRTHPPVSKALRGMGRRHVGVDGERSGVDCMGRTAHKPLMGGLITVVPFCYNPSSRLICTLMTGLDDKKNPLTPPPHKTQPLFPEAPFFQFQFSPVVMAA